MTQKKWFLILVAALSVALPGCGGSGNSFDSSDPNGAFSMTLTPDTDGGSISHVAIEIEAKGGTIESGVALLVSDGFDRFTTDKISGTAENGRIFAEIELKGSVLQLDAEFNGIAWDGDFQIVQGKKVLQSGELEISRADETANLIGDWAGEIEFEGKTEEVVLEFDQEGNSIIAQGTINGIFHVTFDIGSVVGNSVYFYAQPDIAGYIFFGNVSSSGNRMTGEGFNGKPFTFELERVDD